MGDKNKKIVDVCQNEIIQEYIDDFGLMTYIKQSEKKPRKKLIIKPKKYEHLAIVSDKKVVEIKEAIVNNDVEKINNMTNKINGNLLKYLDRNIRIFIGNNNQIWFCGKDVGTILKYKEPTDVIRNNIDNNNKKTYEQLINENVGSKNLDPEKIKKIQKQTVFISKESTIWLAVKSSARCAEDFQNYVKKLLNKIDDGEDIYEEDVFTTETKFVKHPNAYEPYVKYNSAFDIKDENTLYLAEIGVADSVGHDTNVLKGDRLFKFGITCRGLDRNDEHQKNIDDFVTFYYVKYIFNKKLEDALKYELYHKKMSRFCRFNNGIKYTELFTVNENFTIDDVKCFIENYINKNDPNKECSGEKLLEIEKERTRQMCETTIHMQEKTKQEQAIAEQKRYEYEIFKLQMKKK